MFDLTEKEKKIVLIIVVLILMGWFLNYFYQKNQSHTKIIISQKKQSLNLVNQNNNSNNNSQIIVDINGEVSKPGIYKLKSGSRVYELIEKAGGETKNADLSALNLAAKLQDGEKIIVPKKNSLSVNTILDNTTQINNNQTTNSKITAGQIININTATEAQLDTLPGIGPATAKKIIDYRNTQGKFSTKEDLLKVKGIGEKKFTQIKNYITVN